MIKIPNFLFHILGLDAVAMETIISSSTYDSLPLVILRVKSSVKREKKSAGEKLRFSFITATSSSSAFQLLFHQK